MLVYANTPPSTLAPKSWFFCDIICVLSLANNFRIEILLWFNFVNKIWRLIFYKSDELSIYKSDKLKVDNLYVILS
jgi:hypothetical protein